MERWKDSNSRFVAAISKSRTLCYVKHPARLRNRGYNLTFSHNGNCWFATLVRTEEQAGNIMVGAAMVMAALGGAWWPIAITPKFMQTVGHLFPSSWAMDAFQAIILQGATIGEVLPQAGILLGYAILFFALGVWRLKFE